MAFIFEGGKHKPRFPAKHFSQMCFVVVVLIFLTIKIFQNESFGHFFLKRNQNYY